MPSMVSETVPLWKKYVPVVKAIKKGLTENSKVSQDQFFFNDVTWNDLKKEKNGGNSVTSNEVRTINKNNY